MVARLAVRGRASINSIDYIYQHNGMVYYITGHIQIINITFIGIISLKYEIINCLNLARVGDLAEMW